MDITLKKALPAVLASLGVAFIFNFLFFGKFPGISAPVFAVILLGSAAALARLSGRRLSVIKNGWLVLPIVFFASMAAVRANEFLAFLNICAALGLLLLLACQFAGMPVFLMKLRDYLAAVFLVPFRMLGRAFAALAAFGQIHSAAKSRDAWLRAAKGIIMAVPALVVFGALFSQADLAFSHFLKGFFDITISEHSVQYLAWLLFAFIAGLGFFSYMFLPKGTLPAASPEAPAAPVAPGRGIEVMVFLGLIALLFLVFIGFQVAYLFGGEANIAGAGFTYAEYARRGFWELLAAAAMSLVLLLAAEKYAGGKPQAGARFLVPALALAAEVAVVIVSAFKRLSLYIDAYGLTMLRFYVAGFIVLLMALFVLLAVKFAKSKPERFFAFGLLVSAIVFLAAVNFANPDAFIARFNADRFSRTGKLDVPYMGTLSADAAPAKLNLYQNAAGETKAMIKNSLINQKEYLQKTASNWQSYNYSRARALRMLQGLE